MPVWGYLLGCAVVLYLAVLVGMFVFQSRMLFQPDVPTRRLEATPASVGLAFETVQLVTADGVALHGWFVPAPPGGRGQVVLFLHGNAGNISHRLERLQLFHGMGLATLIVDYRGYGCSAGHPTEAGLYADALAAWRHLLETRGFAPRDVVVFGHSLGGGVATHLASAHVPRALVVEASFTSVPAAAAEHYPWLPARWLSRFRFPSAANLARVSCPVLVIHSRDDRVIGFHHGRRLYAAAGHPKRFMEIEGDHDRGYLDTGEHYVTELTDFLDSLPGPAPIA